MEQDGASVLGLAAAFIGTHTPRLDDKGRLILPAKFRPRFSAGLVMVRGQEHCVFLLPVDVFNRMQQGMSAAPLTSKQARDYMRVLLSGAEDVMPDRQGRVSIPAHLRRYANLDREVAVIGMGDRVEVWDGPTWNAYLEQTESGYADTTEEVFPNGPF